MFLKKDKKRKTKETHRVPTPHNRILSTAHLPDKDRFDTKGRYTKTPQCHILRDTKAGTSTDPDSLGIPHGMDMDEAIRLLSGRYYLYHAYDDRTRAYLMVFWPKPGGTVSGYIAFDRCQKVSSIHIQTGHGVESMFPPTWVFMLPASLYRRLTKKDVCHLDPWELGIALEEIYARRGMRSLEDHTHAYFIQQSWYEGVIDEDKFTDDMLSDIERYNAEFLRKETALWYIRHKNSSAYRDRDPMIHKNIDPPPTCSYPIKG